MADQPPSWERVLVLAPVGRDASIAAGQLTSAGLSTVVCRDAADLRRELEDPAGVAVVAQEALRTGAIADLRAWIAQQPQWSDFPFIVFTTSGAADEQKGGASSLTPLGNVTFLERPVRIVTLLSAVQAALRARRRQYQVRDLVGALELAVAQRDRFLATLSHELRNPLAAMLSATALAEVEERRQDETLASRLAVPRAIVRRQGEILTRLVDDLLEVSRLSTGKVHLKRTTVNLDDLARRCVDAVRLRTGRTDIGLRCGTPAALVLGDPVRLEQMLLNLLTNAVKYTPPPGTIEVECRGEGSLATVTVSDTGVGISAELLPHVFDLFKQADVTLDRSQGGLGIGLSLVRAMVEMHDGEVVAESAGPGLGSRFTVRFPLVEASTVEPPASDTLPVASTKAPPAASRSVFVVEDQPDNRVALVSLLTALGHRVDFAEDGVTGADQIIAARPDVALVDIGLPGLDGYEVARRVRAVLGSSVLLIALTGYGQVEDRHRALEAGFNLHLTKPVDFGELTGLLASTAPAPDPI
jgi:signal transduction histidine kinase/ActR/RegA family two-component response regulator